MSATRSEASAALLLTRRDVMQLLPLPDCIAAVESAFRAHGEDIAPPPGILGLHARDGSFHIKAGILGNFFAAKLNANFPGNPGKNGLSTIQGMILLCDAENGRPLAVMDSMEITSLRTGAATAIAAKHLARPDSRVAAICGCGSQGRAQLRALRCVLPIELAFAFDREGDAAARFATEMARELGIEVRNVSSVREAAAHCDVCVSCTTSRAAFLHQNDVRAGTFIAAVGADNPEKQEIAPELMAASKIVVDVVEQCAAIGDLHHALAAGVVKRTDVHAELGELVAGKKCGRSSREEITIFDSTGMALQDVAAAAAAYERALAAGRGARINFAE